MHSPVAPHLPPENSGAFSPTGAAPKARRPQQPDTQKNPRDVEATRGFGEGVMFLRGSDRHRSGDLSIFSRTLYQLSYRARHSLWVTA